MTAIGQVRECGGHDVARHSGQRIIASFREKHQNAALRPTAHGVARQLSGCLTHDGRSATIMAVH
ncbi:hypothetical protein [Burkholderia ubonensis]|uniref:hypothetical protein n=1 Tax=Burkholderia ubonensis TaxID=101571 RepID=UPI0012F81A58|nr:hypothetical protein [Burkholderia ubonensis]